MTGGKVQTTRDAFIARNLGSTGSATLVGTLAIDLIDVFNPAYGDRFVIMTFALRIGIFTSESGLLLSNTRGLAPIYSSSALTLLTTAPGDANADGKVNALDLNVLALNWQQTGTADWTGDGKVNALDLNLLALNCQFGVGDPNLVSFDEAWTDVLASVAIPEPGTGVVLGLGAVAVATKRRRTA